MCTFELRSKVFTFEKTQINLVFCSLIRTFAPDFKKTIKGCSRVWAEMIPSEPDTDNADAGMMSNTKTTPYLMY